ncbi:MAG: hypothetical protein J2P27_18845, partial [Actinobacteria bacterium]|nr:hypothetical protein [Actinomycetota bacterium]
GPPGAADAPGHHGARGPFEPLRSQGYGSKQFRHDAQLPGPAQETAGAPLPVPERGSWSVQGDTYRGLPRRVRQASLAPQLDNRRAPASGPEPSGAELTAQPPDLTPSKLSSLQDGWQRGRTAELDGSGGPGDGPGRQSTDADDGDSR